MSEVIVRPAIQEDAKAVQEVLYRTWMETYPDETVGITKADIEAFFGDPFSLETMDAWRKDIALANDAYAILVAEYDGKVVGVCRAFVREHENQIQAIYVLAEHQGKGIGGSLLDALTTFFDPSKDTLVQVAEYNTRARAFYERHGFADTGTRLRQPHFKMPVSGNVIPEIEMRKQKERG